MPDKTQRIAPRLIVNPVYWPTWIGLGLLWLATRLPYRVMLLLGAGLGFLGLIVLAERRRISRANIRLCFPQLDRAAQRRLLRRNFYSNGMSLFEAAWAWWASDAKIKPLLQIEGLDNLEAAEQLHKGVLLLGGHYTTLEISGRLLAYLRDNVYPTYKPAHNDLFEAIMTRNRRRTNRGLIPSDNMRGILKLLKQEQIIWYAPDQDFGGDRSVFAPFMGVQTSTLTMSSRLARASSAPVVPFYSERLPGAQGYRLRFGPMLENFPAGDDVRDATQVNAAIEQHVRHVPEQYLWGHRRFKTRPHGDPQVYPLRRGKFLRRYTQAHILLCIPAVCYTAWVALRYRQWHYLTERLGLARYRRADMLIHAASIGEVNAIAPLLDLIRARNPELKILFTVNTPSGRTTAHQRFADNVDYAYLPIDWRWAANRFMRNVRPSCLLITETELWPNLYAYCYEHGLRNIIINARLSERSVDTSFMVRSWLSEAIQFTFAILARSQEDAKRYLRLGAKAEYVKVLGNIKYAGGPPTHLTPINLQRDYVLFASSRDGEERQIVTTWLSLPGNKPLLVIVPRHIKRLPVILKDLQALAIQPAVRSHHDPIDASTQVYIADTFGEMGAFIAGSRFVIMGGSFEKFGGQNIIEVARAGKAVVFGPHMHNFRTEAAEFLAAGAAIQVTDQETLARTLTQLLADPAQAETLGRNGRALLEKYQDIAERYYIELQHYCPTLNPSH